MQITDRLIREFPKLKELLPIFNPYEVKVVKRDVFNSTFIMLEDQNGNGYTVKNGIIYVVKPENGGGRKMEQREKILKAWDELDRVKAVEKLIESADVWKNGSIDGCLVWDKEKEEFSVVKESQSTQTPSFIYIFRLSGNDKPDVDEEELYSDLLEVDIEEILKDR